MDDIRYDLLSRYSEERLTLLLFYFKNMNPIEAMYFLGMLTRVLDENMSVAVLAHFLSAQSRNFSYSKYAQRALNYHIHTLSRKITQHLPKILHRFASAIKPFNFVKVGFAKENVRRSMIKSNPFLFLVDSVFEIFVKASNAEIENGIRAYFREKFSRKNIPSPVSSSLELLCRICDEKEKKASIVRIVKTLHAEDVPSVVSFMDEHKEYFEPFLFYSYLVNSKVYEALVDFIIGSKQHFRVDVVRHFVAFDVAKVVKSITNESAQILSYIFGEREVYVPELAKLISEGRVDIDREIILEAFKENCGKLIDYFEFFGLTAQELIEISKDCGQVAPLALKAITTREDLCKFVDCLKEQDDEAVINIIEALHEQDKKEELISTILKRLAVRGRLKKHLLDLYLCNGKFVCELLPYLGKQEVYKYVPEHIVDDESLSAFLRVVEGSELLIFVHRMADRVRAGNILNICLESSRFTESDFLFALTTLERELSPLVIRTISQALQKFPNMGNFITSLLSRLVKDDVFGKIEMTSEMITCLEIVGPVAIEMLADLDEKVMCKILNNSQRLLEMCRECFYKRRLSAAQKDKLKFAMSQVFNKR